MRQFKEHRIFVVESTFPTGRDDDDEKFSRYYASAYTDSRDPGKEPTKLFVVVNADVCTEGRVEKGADDHRYEDTLTFRTEEQAVACAKRLKEFGRVRCGWDGPEDWRVKYRKPLNVRVREEILIKISEVKTIDV